MEVTLTDKERLHLIDCLKCAATMQGSSTEFQRRLHHKLQAPDRHRKYKKLKQEFGE
jgi:hypothetical protein